MVYWKRTYIGEVTPVKNNVIPGGGFHHIALRASDFDKSFEFYTKGLGFEACLVWGEGDGRGAMLDMGDGTILELFGGGSGKSDSSENYRAGKFFHLAIQTTDTDKSYAAALAAGAVADRPPCDIVIKGAEKELPARIAFVYGPDGEWLEFFQTK